MVSRVPVRWLTLLMVASAVALLGCGGGSTDRPSTFAAGELPEAQSFLGSLKPPRGFTPETKTCIKGPMTRCFTSHRVVRPLTSARLVATIRQLGFKPDASNSRCQLRRRAGRRLVYCDGFGTLGRYNGGYAAWSSPSSKAKLAGTRISLSISSVAH
jgi:hypothetical protein